jgi:transcriptional regulator with XRE-family HTH domain
MDSSFGDLLKDWRVQRRLSQLDLGLAANVSARHISFLETGRAKPSRSMVLQLSETMQVPRAVRNVLLNAAGFVDAYRSRDLSANDMAPIRAAIAWTLDRHDPFPALALDRHWTLVNANKAATHILGAVGIGIGDSLLDALTHDSALRSALENWPEVRQHLLVRLQVESAQLGNDVTLEAAAAVLAREAVAADHDTPGVLSAVIPAKYRFGGTVLSLFSTIAQFGTAEDIALADLKIELMFPADEFTREALLAAQAGDTSQRSPVRKRVRKQ